LFVCCKHTIDSPDTTVYLSFDEIENIITSTPDGDTVNIPAGTCIVENQIVINKSIVIIGAGIDKTIFKGIPNLNAFILRSNKADSIRISGITFNMYGTEGGGVYVKGEHHDFRIDHCKFTEANGRPVEIEDFCDGVIDHCEFLDNRITDITIYGDGDPAWIRPKYLGLEINANNRTGVVFIEDCSFTYEQVWVEKNKPSEHAISSNHGSRYVFRNNIINVGYYNDGTGSHMMGAPIDAHGSFEYPPGSVSYEIYNNTIISTHSYRGMFIRGGTGVIFNNKFNGDFTVPIELTDYRLLDNDVSSLPDQRVKDLYLWNNTDDADTPVPIYVNQGNGNILADYIRLGFEFFDENKIDKGIYTPYTYPHPLVK
jgi:hypothetical protein